MARLELAASWSQTAARTRCYRCMNYIWRCLVRKTCSPALFSPLSPRPPKAVVVKHVVVQQRSRGFAVFCRDPRERLDCSSDRAESQGRFGYFYAHFLRRSRQRNTACGSASTWVYFAQKTIIIGKAKNDEIAVFLLNTVENCGKTWYNTKSYVLQG